MAEVVRKLSSLALAIAGSYALTACAQTHRNVQQEQQSRFMRQVALEHEWWGLRWQARNRTLAALTPAHRRFVGQIIGQLAVEAKPNTAQAITELDRTLTKEEKKSVLEASSWLRKRSRFFFDFEGKQLLATYPTMNLDTTFKGAPEDPGATLLVMATNTIALNASLEARRMWLARSRHLRKD
jgi:hypothetical protein